MQKCLPLRKPGSGFENLQAGAESSIIFMQRFPI
jgi:hypothetical protein